MSNLSNFKAFLIMVSFSFFGTLAICLCAMGCGAVLTPTQTNAVTLGVDTTVCILTHITEPPATIAQTCLADPTDIADVNKVLAAHYSAEALEKVQPDAGL